MGALEDLAATLLGDQTQQAIAAENPYYRLRAVPDQTSELLGQVAQKAPGRYKTRDLAIAGGFSGLVSGLLGGQGDSYQQTLTDRLANATGQAAQGMAPSAEGLSPSLFSRAQRTGTLWKMQKGLEDQRLTNEIEKAKQIESAKNDADIKKEIVKTALDNPRKFNRALPSLERLFGNKVSGLNTEAPQVDQQMPAQESNSIAATKPATGRGVEGSIADEISAQANKFMDEGADSDQAFIRAGRIYDIKREQLAKQYQRMEDSAKAGAELENLTNQIRITLQDAGDTGFAGGAKQLVAGAAGMFSENQAKKYAAGNDLETFRNEAVKTFGRAFKGPMSDNDVKIMLSAAPSLSNEETTNANILDRWDYAAKLQKQYADFMYEQQQAGVPVAQAEREWSQLRAKNPYVIKRGGKYEINPVWATGALFANNDTPPDDQGDGGAGGNDGIGGGTGSQMQTSFSPQGQEKPAVDSALQQTGEVLKSYGSGILKTPQAIKGMFSPSTYKEAFKSPESGAQFVGQNASMLAGAIPGAQAGAAIGALGGPAAPITVPLGTLVGGGIGAGLGYLGFNSATEAGSELAGVGTDKSVVPTFNDVKEAADVAGQATGVGAAGKIAVKSVGAGKAMSGKVADLTERAVTKAKENIIGKPGDLSTAEAKGTFKYYDKAGNEVPAKNAADYQTGIEQSIETVTKDGFFENAKNSPRATKLEFDKKLNNTAEEISNLHEQAGAALEEIHKSLPEIQQKQFPLTRNPKTGKGGFNPDFSSVGAKITELTRSDPQVGKALKQRAQAVIDRWNKSSKSYELLQTYKSSLGKNTKWQAASTEVANAWNEIKQELYSSFASEQMRAYKYAMEQSGKPEAVNALAEANKKYTAYSNLKPFISKKATARKSLFSGGRGVVGNAVSMATRAIVPEQRTLLNIANTANSIAQKPRSLFSMAESNLGKVPVGARSLATTMPVSAQKAQENIPAPLMGLPADQLLNALRQVESGGNPNAVSPVGAQGAYQFMPAMSKAFGIDPFNEEQSRTAAAELLRQEYEALKSPELALAAYNAGRPAVLRAINRAKSNDWQRVAQYLPEETRNYVPKILSKLG